MSSQEESMAWTPGATARATLAVPFFRALSPVQGYGNPGGGLSYQGLIISGHATLSRRRSTGRFFGGSGSGPSRGGFPFSSAENWRSMPLASRMEVEQGRTSR